MRLVSLFFLILFFSYRLNAQPIADSVFSDKVKSVKIFAGQNQLTYPVIALGTQDKLTLRFDLLGNSSERLQYEVIHCNWKWEPSQQLSSSDYIDGFDYNDVQEFQISFNTLEPYTNYRIVLPNDDLNFLLSGNYIIRVYPVNEPDSILLQKRFVVVENQAFIQASVKRATQAALRNTHQQVDFVVKTSGLGLIDIGTNLRAVVMQNFRFDNAQFCEQPSYFQGEDLVFGNSGQCVFEGGNEFRIFDISDFKYLVKSVYRYEALGGVYYCYLIADNKHFTHWTSYDQNGRFAVGAKQGYEPWTEADYAYVNFTLLSNEPFWDGDVFIFGELTNWKVDPAFKMEYSDSAKAYVAQLFLKQGMYNYSYLFVPRSGPPTFAKTEGNFSQTENSYQIFVYYFDPKLQADRVIAYKLLSAYR